MSNKLTLFFCGGTGINLGKTYSKFVGRTREGFAEIEAVFVDTSVSNDDELVPADKFFHIENADRDEKLDGSGKNRKKNLEAIEASLGTILRDHPPSKFNVFINSAGGGSGSAIGPMLMHEVMSRGHEGIAICVGNTASGTEIKNTKDSLMTYQGICDDLERPVNVFYRQNTGRTRQEVDKDVHTFLAGLFAIFSGMNRELDTEDYVNFLNYNQVTKQVPQLGFIDLYSQTITLDKGQSLISLVTVADNEADNTESNIPVDYQAVGFINQSARETFRTAAPIHLAVIGGFFGTFINDLKRREKELDELRSVNTVRSIIDTEAGKTRTKRGIIVS